MRGLLGIAVILFAGLGAERGPGADPVAGGCGGVLLQFGLALLFLTFPPPARRSCC